MIKNKLILLGMMFVFSCHGELSPFDVEEQKTVTFSPPSWIIGRWSSGDMSFIFSSDNIVMVSTGISMSFKESFSSAEVSETVISSNQYTFVITATGIDQKYSFIKQSESNLLYSLTYSGVTISGISLSK